MAKVVWIVGAGFSKSLGGPLLADLLSDWSQRRISQEYDDALLDGGRVDNKGSLDRETLFASAEAKAVYALYRTFRGRVWEHAEEFLDFLDAESRDETSRAELGLMLRQGDVTLLGSLRDPRLLTSVARRMVAAQCCAFLRHNPTSLERWEPYLRWVSMLRHDDTIVSFNYDRVIETVSKSKEALDQRCRGVHVLTFERDLNPDSEIVKAKRADSAVLVKLHGSVDWLNDDRKRDAGLMPFTVASDPEHAVYAPLDERSPICMPGGSKKQMTGSELKPLWDYARARIEESDAIVFLGYSFPRSDSKARGDILDAIAHQKVPYVRRRRVYIVLGDNAPASARVEHLLRHAAKRSGRGHDVTPEPLFVEDFLSVFDHEKL